MLFKEKGMYILMILENNVPYADFQFKMKCLSVEYKYVYISNNIHTHTNKIYNFVIIPR